MALNKNALIDSTYYFQMSDDEAMLEDEQIKNMIEDTINAVSTQFEKFCNRILVERTFTHDVADTDNYDFNLFETASDSDFSDENDTLIDLVECTTDGTEVYIDVEDTISHAAIETWHAIMFEHSDGTANSILITIHGWYNANVD